MNEISFKLVNITKKFDERVVLNNINCDFNRCGLYAFIGENGSGKSTLLSILACNLKPNSGHVLLNNRVCNSAEFYSDIAYIPDKVLAYPFITGIEFIELISILRKVDPENYNALIRRFNLEEHKYTKFENMSLGTAKKFMLISGLMTKCKVLVMDEPTNGLDIHSVDVLNDILLKMRTDKMIFMTSHDQFILESPFVEKIEINQLNDSS
ncbi:ATP-binding cassette domain-containing protein [Acinetobacter rathckeae]|uniref:ATP-binding cassette domain-containing protein n=1 Tax=Acinetobacter rathckeae TaxID=2605272 RepID=UPI0018A25897|nr:ABC transporter ATP-binding protein [Acinetobacter rathckeae]MBF7687602.1 ABC transporter ATP-binding protein [Acinetobacter rathckeae]MBF7695004.1 ABC transporter ATP-binding protein [Acinetobacter rathckeae]